MCGTFLIDLNKELYGNVPHVFVNYRAGVTGIKCGTKKTIRILNTISNVPHLTMTKYEFYRRKPFPHL